jgi:serine/threonine protein kinase
MAADSPLPEPTGTFTPAPETQACAAPGAVTEAPGGWIGYYKLLQKIGEGGMGTVYMAEQEQPVRRRIAIKIIKPGMDSAQVIARFEAERQALAMMDHQHIARVLDAGTTPNGRPFFVMELVQGVPITEYCDKARLTPRERLELFVSVCQAIQHAHQKGIIHRDVKPSNILVTLADGKPVPKVIDFGLAKATEQRLTERTVFTQYGTIVGTFEYMSPEQAEMSPLGIDTRSDIYSLGVVLYELLTGTTPLDRKRLRAAAYTEMVRMIREEEPPRPSTRLASSEALPAIAAARKMEPVKLTRHVRGELDWIVMKALEKDRTRRYETANGLARDVERYLHDEPVEACPPSTGYRLRKFVRRNKGPVLATALVLLVLVAAVVLSTWQAIRATLAKAEVERQRDIAREQKRRTREALDAMTSGETLDWLMTQRKLEPHQKKFLERALAYYQEFATEAVDDAEGQKLLAEAHHRVARMLYSLGQHQEAMQSYRRAIEHWERLAAQYPHVPQYRQGLGESMWRLGWGLPRWGKWAEAEAKFRRAAELFERLAAEHPDVPQYRNSQAWSLSLLSNALAQQSKHPEAEAAFAKVIKLQEQLVADQPGVPEYRRKLGFTLHNFGLLLHELERRSEAEAAYRRTVELLERVVTELPDVAFYRSELADSNHDLGMLLNELGKYPEAETAYRRALELFERLVVEQPAVDDYWTELALTRSHLGKLLRGLDKPAQAETAHRQALGAFDRALELDEGTRRTELRLGRADALARIGEVAKALAAADELAAASNLAANDLYGLACVYALAAAKLPLPDADRAPAQAIATLREAIAKGYRNLAHLRKNPDLDALRSREDFQKLLAELEASKEKGGK